jgi:hypothetical protein
LFYFCHLKKLVRPENFGSYYVYHTFAGGYTMSFLCGRRRPDVFELNTVPPPIHWTKLDLKLIISLLLNRASSYVTPTLKYSSLIKKYFDVVSKRSTDDNGLKQHKLTKCILIDFHVSHLHIGP